MELLKELCSIHAPSGNEENVKQFILKYINKNQDNWLSTPNVVSGGDFQDCVLLIFGQPRTAVFAHIDTIGFTARYENQLIPIGGPEVETGYQIRGSDSIGPIACKLIIDDENRVFHSFARPIDPGVDLSFEPNFEETQHYVQCCSLDNRLGVYNALNLAETLQDGIIVFSCYEEHGGGTMPFLIKYIYEEYNIRQALISDITSVTEGVQSGKGVVISLRDRHIPRKLFTNQIRAIAIQHHIPFQIEVEADGSSDGREIQLSPYPIDWCFIGAPEENAHTPFEKVNKKDIQAMLELYKVLLQEL